MIISQKLDYTYDYNDYAYKYNADRYITQTIEDHAYLMQKQLARLWGNRRRGLIYTGPYVPVFITEVHYEK